jgi:type I protein arginine methyltransferase
VDRRKLEDYKAMMTDAVRMDAYRRSISAVCPGKVVCEIGVGLAPLSLMALEAGATRVYGVEFHAETLDVAVQIIAANGYGPDRFIPIQGLSTEISLPERVDVLLSETLDSMGIGENTAVYMADARARLMAPDAVFLPATLDCHVALASPQAYASEMAFWNETMPGAYGFDYARASEEFKTCKHTLSVLSAELHSGWSPWQTIDFLDDATYRRLVPMAIPVTRAGTILGFATAFDAELSEGVHLRTFPDDPETHWFQGFNAFPEPIKAEAGDLVYMELQIEPGDSPAIRFEMRVVCGKEAEVTAFVHQRMVALKEQLV